MSEGKRQSSLLKEANYKRLSAIFFAILVANYYVLSLFVLPALPFTLMWIAPLYTECTDMLLMFSVGYMYAPVAAVQTLPE
jgi:hypothetical protein